MQILLLGREIDASQKLGLIEKTRYIVADNCCSYWLNVSLATSYNIFVSFTVVFPLQHLCRIAIRRCMGVARRRRIKELPLPPHLISYLCSLPVSCSDQLHEGWIRTKSGKDISVKTKHAARRPKTSKYVGIHQIRQQLSPSSDD